jgi:hypothetical protein
MNDALPPTCPACGATVRADVSWCTQCYAPLRQPRETAVDVPEEAGGTASSADAERLAEQMLAQLAVERDELTGLTSRLPSTPGGRAALVAAVILLGTGVILLLMYVLGAIV